MDLPQSDPTEKPVSVSGKVWLLAARPRTLAAAVVPVMVGTAFAIQLGEGSPVPALLCLLFALLIQVGTNYANDYFDFLKGADTAERLGPTRVTAAGLVSPQTMRWATAAVFVLAFLIGLNLVFYGGWWLVAIGATSILCGLAYTGGPFPLAYNGLGDLFVFVFFGLVAVAFTFYVQTGFFVSEVWIGGAAVGFLAVNILVVNNLRDRETDAKADKNTLIVRLGRRFGIAQFALSHVLAAAIPFLLFLQGGKVMVLLPVLLLPLAIRMFARLLAAESGEDHNRLLGKSGAFLILYGILFSVGIVGS